MKVHIRKNIALMIALAMVFTMTACGDKGEENTEEPVQEEQAEQSEETQEEQGEQEEETKEDDSIYSLSVDELMGSITEDWLYDRYPSDKDHEKVVSILNNAAGKTVSEKEAKANKLNPEYLDYDSGPWSCELYLKDRDETVEELDNDDITPGEIIMICNWYSELVRVTVSRSNKTEYYDDKTLYDYVRHYHDFDEIVDEEAAARYKVRLDRIAEINKTDLEDGFGWTGTMDLIRFVKDMEFEASDGSGMIEIYRFDFAYTLDDFSKYTGGAGGMHLDGDMRVQGMGNAYGQLAGKIENGNLVSIFYIGNDWGIDPDSEDEEYLEYCKKTLEEGLKNKDNWV